MLYNPPSGSSDANAPYVGKNTAGGTQGSKVPPAAIEYTQREIVAAIAASNQAPTNTVLVQAAMALGRGIWVDNLTGSGDLAVATLGVVLPSLLKGMRIGATATAANTITTPKLRVVNLVSAAGYVDFPIVKQDGSALAAGDIVPGRIYRFEADGAGNVLISGGGIASGPKAQPLLQANTTYYVNASTGSDSNTGATAGTAFATIQAAINAIAKFNLNGFAVTINVANGTYPKVTLLPTSGSGQVIITGNTNAPGSVVIAGVNDNAIYAPSCGQAYVISGITLSTSGASSTASMAGLVATGSGTTVTFLNGGFGACVGGHIISAQKALVYIGGAIAISGGCPGGYPVAYGASLVAGDGGTIFSIPGSLPVFTLTNTPGFPQGFAFASVLSEIAIQIGGLSGSATGPRYTGLFTSVINTGGGGANALPGNSAGSIDSTSRYN